MTYALECTAHFISEQRSELYKKYYSGAVQMKNGLSAENTLEEQTCSGLERCGA